MTYERIDTADATTLRFEGSLDALATPAIRLVFDELVTAGKKSVLLDLTELRIIDSSGVGAIVSLYKKMRAQGGEVRIKGLKDQPLAVFKLLRLDRVFPL
jgi:anti-sigma B factor antagonist